MKDPSTSSAAISLPPGASPLEYARQVVALLEEDFSAELVSFDVRNRAVHLELRVPVDTKTT